MSGDDSISLAIKGSVGGFALDIAFEAPSRGITCLFGPSGCGKTTILRCIAGLQCVPGRLAIRTETWQDSTAGIFRPPHARHVGYVFQEASLFSHLSVRANLLFGARRVRRTGGKPPLSFEDAVDLLGLASLLDRAPATLSGGERQRVAVGRALLAEPRVLLMDEPLSALDRFTKEEILPYFEMLHERLSVPVLYVTHDVSEVERLADTLILLRQGSVLGAGPLRELQTDPDLPLLAAPGATVILDAEVGRIDEAFSLTELSVEGGTLLVPGRHGKHGDKRRLRIAASDVSLARTAARDSTILNCLPARIVSITGGADEPQASVILALGEDGSGSRIAARITRKSLHTLTLAPGHAVYAQIKSAGLIASRAVLGSSGNQS